MSLPSAGMVFKPCPTNRFVFAHRKSFLSLFTRKALGTYVLLQDTLIRDHLQMWMSTWGGETEIRPFIQ